MDRRRKGHDGRFGSPSAAEALAAKQAEIAERSDAVPTNGGTVVPYIPSWILWTIGTLIVLGAAAFAGPVGSDTFKLWLLGFDCFPQ